MKHSAARVGILIGIALGFVLFDWGIYTVFTRRCISDYGAEMQAKSVELTRYLPFTEESDVVRVPSDFQMTGDLPILDSAAALYPITAAVVQALYPPEACIYDAAKGEFAVESCLQMHNTRDAYRRIVDGSVDLAVLAAPSAEQTAYAQEQGVTLTFMPVGREAFVFLVNAQNPVDGLTCDEVRGIYRGVYTNWKQLGGVNKPISALQRNAGSGSQSAFLRFMGDTEAKTDYDSFLGSAIGFSFRYYVEGIVSDGGVKQLALDGVYPSKENVQNETYPLVSNFYAVYRADNANPNVTAVVDWLLSSTGQGVIERVGYVPLG